MRRRHKYGSNTHLRYLHGDLSNVWLQDSHHRYAAHIIVVRNHPSGDPSSSREDIEITKKLVETGKIIGSMSWTMSSSVTAGIIA
ncbi:MAG: hypothetical protein O8C58_05005 [Candidatus Methanoperedens sp.]|nr:hypothetical protein [Candidatus Methanoperedens sp.]